MALGLVHAASALPWRSQHCLASSAACSSAAWGFSSVKIPHVKQMPVLGNPGECSLQCLWGKKSIGPNKNAGRVAVSDDDLYDVDEVLDDQIESTLDMLDEGADKTAEETQTGLAMMPSGAIAEGEMVAGTVVDYKINEEEFHKISLYECDFFIRKAPDPDNDVYDFSEMYVTPPDTDVYSIPRIIGNMPKQRARCTKQKWDRICLVLHNDRINPRAPMGKNEFRTMKVFLMKHFNNRRAEADNFVLNFEKIYVIDGKTKSIRKAKVKVEVPGGKDRDRSQEVLTVRDGGNSFCIIPKEQRKTPDQIIGEYQWNKSREEMESYLRTFRDFEVSNWF